MSDQVSIKTLKDKLGLKSDMRVGIINPSESFLNELAEFKFKAEKVKSLKKDLDYIHYFAKTRKELEEVFPKLRKHLAKIGMLWVSNPKKDSNIESDLNQNLVMEIGLQNGLVDVKICSIDENWSAMKFVFRLKDR